MAIARRTFISAIIINVAFNQPLTLTFIAKVNMAVGSSFTIMNTLPVKKDIITIHYRHNRTTRRPKTATTAKQNFDNGAVRRDTSELAMMNNFITEFEPIKKNRPNDK